MKRLWIKRGILTLVIIGLAAAAGYLFFLLHQERQARMEMMSRVDYSLLAPEQLGAVVQRDLGVSLDDLKQKGPQEVGLRHFPQVFLAARTLGWVYEEKQALVYYQRAAELLDSYTDDKAVRLAFYGHYNALVPFMDEATRERVGKIYESLADPGE